MRKSIIYSVLVLLFSFPTLVFSQISDSVCIYFDIDSYTIKGENIRWLDEILLKQNLSNVKITAYTDFLGSSDHNNQLSQNRAVAVKNYLLSKGLSDDRITECSGKGMHSFSSYENRRNENDRGIREHRVVNISYTCDGDKNLAAKEPEVFHVPVATDPVTVTDIRNITEEDLTAGNKIALKNINFEGGTPNFKPESDVALLELLRVMNEYPDLKIEIQGHICCQTEEEGDGYDNVNGNNRLSENRARAVYDYLVKNGIESSRMTYVGFASKYKLYPYERDSYEQAMNRRVEIKVVEN